MAKFLSFILFIASVGLLVITFFFPLFVYNVGGYSGDVAGQEVSMTFGFDNKCKVKIGDTTIENVTYKFADGKIVLAGLESTILAPFATMNVENAFTVSFGGEGGFKLTSIAGIAFTAGYAIVAIGSLIVFITKLAKK